MTRTGFNLQVNRQRWMAAPSPQLRCRRYLNSDSVSVKQWHSVTSDSTATENATATQRYCSSHYRIMYPTLCLRRFQIVVLAVLMNSPDRNRALSQILVYNREMWCKIEFSFIVHLFYQVPFVSDNFLKKFLIRFEHDVT